MAIKNPTNLFVKFSADLKIDAGNGTVNTQPVLSDNVTIPLSSYSSGSIDLGPGTDETLLGSAELCVISASNAIDFRVTPNTEVITTKMFTYNGATASIYVTNNTSSVVTIEYVLGTEL